MAGTGIGTFNDRAARRRARRRPVRRQPAASRASRPASTPTPTATHGQRLGRRAEGPAAALPGPDQGRADRQPAPTTGSPTPTASTVTGVAGRLQRLAGRLRRSARRGASPTSTRTTTRSSTTRWPTSCRRHLGRRDRARMQVLALSTTVLGAGRRLRRRPAPTGCGPSRWTATRSTPATGSTRSAGTAPQGNGFGAGLPPAADNQDKWPYAQAAAGRPRRWCPAAPRSTWPPPGTRSC